MGKKRIIGFYDYTVVLTYLGMIISFAGILLVFEEKYINSVICLMAAGICDMFDGAVASTKDRNRYEKHFGIQIDSLCDLISFGVLPAVFVYFITGKSPISGAIACVYTLCGLIRLAYFNVQEYERQKYTAARREVYLGIPITSSAIMLPLVFLVYSKADFVGNWIFTVFMIILGAGFVAGVEIKKPNIIGKIVMIAIGIAEMMGVFLMSGIDIL